jgi:RNA polymerase sigma-70 factor (ECF subfamily)
LEGTFAQERARLVGLAYRITGSRLDAEDIVQEAWVRAQGVDWAGVDNAAAWLTTVVSRLALDELKSARRRRESYVGPWLPDPVQTTDDGRTLIAQRQKPEDPADAVELAESLTLGFLRLMEALDPVERVVFLLADVFDTPFGEIAAIVDRSPAACRQVASRARRRLREGRHRHDPPEEAERVMQALLFAVGVGDVDTVVSLLAEDVVLVSDGGAKARAARRPVHGPVKVARFLVNLARRLGPFSAEQALINDEPGVVFRVDGERFMAVAVHVSDGLACELHVVRNPDKLAALDVATELA